MRTISLTPTHLENRERWDIAMYSDLRQNKLMKLIEVNMIIEEIKYLSKNLKRLMRNEYVKTTKIGTFPAKIEQSPIPKGLVLIISPWNMPVCLMGKPLAGAIAAGNAIVIKPSEVSRHVSALFKELVPQYLDKDIIGCIEGGPEETTELLKQKFDHIYYTGSTRVGRMIMKAAVEHLATVTLELGGKCPCFIDESVMKDEKLVTMTCERIFWGKSALSGQACIGVDYCLIEEKFADKFIKGFIKTTEEFFGKNMQQRQNNPDFSRMINERHMYRVKELVDEVRDYVVYGGEMDLDDRYFDITIVKDPPADSKIMSDEIFGPVLLVKTVKSMNEAIDLVNSKSHPLNVYIFSKDRNMIEYIRDQTISGSVAVNECIVQYSETNFKFGGVGESGQGVMNGDDSFYTFSHQRSMLTSLSDSRPKFRFPPYKDADMAQVNNAATSPIMTNFIIPIMMFVMFLFVRIFRK
jgi:aldehyde dehydrogenase (NAD+)